MIVFFNSSGELIKNSPERVFQGSNKANTVYFCCPTASSNAVSVAFSLPTGNTTKEHILYPLSNGVELPEVFDKNCEMFNVWTIDIPSIVTAESGKVSMQFYLYSVEQIVSTEKITFVVERGVEPTDYPSETEGFQELLEYFVLFRSEYEQKKQDFEKSV